MVSMRKANIFFIYLAANLALAFTLFLHSRFAVKDAVPGFALKSEMVKRLGLTDLCLFTEARYTRHLSQTDSNTPFQDHPMSLEHFPSGSLVEPPAFLRIRTDKL